MTKKLCVFPNDPIKAYYEKGELKERYFNPNNFFDEIHIISFIDNDVKEEKVQQIVGNAKLVIHSVGKINIINRSKNIKKIIELVDSIKPDVIRSFNSLVEGWCASECAKKLNVPFLLSLHTQYDQNRKLARKSNMKKFLALKYTEKFIEPNVLSTADKIIIVYKIIEPYVLKHSKTKPELLYNKINYNQFVNALPIESLPKPLIISVGNLIKEKNHQCIIKAMKELDANCLIIGKGNLHEELIKLIKNNKLENKIIFKYSVPHNEIQKYYKSAKIFALAYDPELEGLPIPVIEAMATGLPVVIPYPREGYSDKLEDVAMFSKRDPGSFSKNIKKLLDDQILYKKISEKSLEKAKEFDSNIIEKREAEIYLELIS